MEVYYYNYCGFSVPSVHLAPPGSFSQAAASSGTLWNVLSPSIMQMRNSQVCTSLHSVLRLPFPICDPLRSCTWGGNGEGSAMSVLQPCSGEGAPRSSAASPFPSEPSEPSQFPHSQRLLPCLAFPFPSSHLSWSLCFSHSWKNLYNPNQQSGTFFLFGFAFVLGGSLGVLLFFPHVNPSEPSLAVPSLTISADGCPGDAGRGRDVVGGGLLGHQSHHGAVWHLGRQSRAAQGDSWDPRLLIQQIPGHSPRLQPEPEGNEF